MKNTSIRPARSRSRFAFTLIEMLVVISIIGTLAAMLMPTLSKARLKAQVRKAQLEIEGVVAAINQYDGTYSRFPASSEIFKAFAAAREDFTYGGTSFQDTNGAALTIGSATNNAQVIAILMDLEYFGDGTPTINTNHVKNPQKLKLLNAKLVSDDVAAGVGSDGVYRDPWGSPYIITLDLNSDEKCRDAFYRRMAVSQRSSQTGYNGLVNSIDALGAGDHFEHIGPVMVWSVGPDKKADPTSKADQGVNKDNILSWK